MPTAFQNPSPFAASQQNSPLAKAEDAPQSVPVTLYTPEDKQYLSYLQTRLERAKRQRDIPHPEFNNKTYGQYYEENLKIANTFLEAKKSDDDVVISSGTVEAKLDSLLSNINNLNLQSEVHAFDKLHSEIVALGKALEDIIHDTKIRDGGDGGGDDEKRMQRQRELLVQGTVFVQDEWVRKFRKSKKGDKNAWNGEFKWKGWTEKLELCFEGPQRTMLYGPNVFLGDITEFYMENQPYIFVRVIMDYDVAKEKYGQFENWKYVKPGAVAVAVEKDQIQTIYDLKWRLEDLKANQVEIIMYQAQGTDEYQIIINSVLMLPIGFPLSMVTPRGTYNVVKQVFRMHPNFAYGKSFVSSGSVKEVSKILDEMLKLFVIKTRKSITPPYANISGRIIDRKALAPGRISMGIDPGALVPIGTESQGVTAGEANFITQLQDLIDKSTVSDTFTGQQGSRAMTATETLELQRQAQLTLGLTIGVSTLLEKKLDYLRLFIVLENWFEPTGSRVVGVDDARKMVKTYRSTTRDVAIEGEGMGERQVIPYDGDLPSPEVTRRLERRESQRRGKPVRKIFLNPGDLKAAELIWYIVTVPKEQESSAMNKLMFRELLADVISLTQLGSRPDITALEEHFARVWNLPKSRVFGSNVNLEELAATGGDPALSGVRTPEQNKQRQSRGEPTIPTAQIKGGLASAASGA